MLLRHGANIDIGAVYIVSHRVRTMALSPEIQGHAGHGKYPTLKALGRTKPGRTRHNHYGHQVRKITIFTHRNIVSRGLVIHAIDKLQHKQGLVNI